MLTRVANNASCNWVNLFSSVQFSSSAVNKPLNCYALTRQEGSFKQRPRAWWSYPHFLREGPASPIQWCIGGGVYVGIRRIPTSGFSWTAYTHLSDHNKQGTFRPFATPLCVYPLPFLAIHHWPHPHIKLVHRTIGLSAAIGIQNTTSLRLVTDTPLRQLTPTLKTGRSYVMFNSHRRCRFAISLSTFPLQCSSYRVLLT